MLIKLEWSGYRIVKNYDNMLSRFLLIPERHGQTDRQTDRFAISISRVSVLTRDKNWPNFRIHAIQICETGSNEQIISVKLFFVVSLLCPSQLKHVSSEMMTNVACFINVQQRFIIFTTSVSNDI